MKPILLKLIFSALYLSSLVAVPQQSTPIDLDNNTSINFFYSGTPRSQLFVNSWGDFSHMAGGRVILEMRGNREFWVRDSGYQTVFSIDPIGESFLKKDFRFYQNLFIEGNLGIGITNPVQAKLAVAGNVLAEEIIIELVSSWPDFVFSKSYLLPDLRDVEKHIKCKGHLPNIPTAEQVENEGLNLGEMNALLLQKIEELTLYQIELLDRLEKAESRIDELEGH